ncbi:MAG: CHAT domain-containing protein, partial [Leptolyngbyaceae cyanobacterium]
LPLHRQVNNPAGEVATLNNMGLIEQSKGALQAALQHFNQALPIVRQLGDRVSEAKALSNIGTVYTALGQPQIALDVFNQALPIFRQVGDRLGEATTLSSRAATYQTMNQLTPAITDWEQALKITLAVRQGLTRDNRQHFLQTSTGRISSLISLLIDQNQPDRAYEWANLATTADLADYSRLVNARVANSSAQQAIDQWNQHNQQLQQLRQRLQEPGLFSEPLSQQVRELERQVYQEAEAIARRFPEVAELFETTPTDIAQLQASIPAGTTVIQPVLLTPARNMPASVALFVLSKDTLSVVKQPIDPAEFETLLINTYQQLTNRWDDTYPDNLAKLHDLLIRPISAQLQATNPKQLSIIAIGKLRYLPFEALYDSKTDQYLIQKYPISYLTRLSPHTLQTAKPQTSNAQPPTIFALGNPVPTAPYQLPGSEAEVNRIAQIFPGSEVFIGQQATLDTFKLQSPRFSLIHLATHGCFRAQGCCLSRAEVCQKSTHIDLPPNTILFANQQTLNIADAALLGWQNTDLITLSACQTALETNSNGEEIAGLAYLFERAGAKATIASLWSAADETTQALMVQFYQNLKQGMGKAEALRRAKLSQIDSHPFFWAPFVLIGDPWATYLNFPWQTPDQPSA